MNKPLLFIIGDDLPLLLDLDKKLTFLGFEIVQANDSTIKDALSEKNRHALVLVASFRRSPDKSMEIVKDVREIYPCVPIIYLTLYSSENRVIALLRAGVSDYIKLPFCEKSLLSSIHRIISFAFPKTSRTDMASALSNNRPKSIIGESGIIKRVKKGILRAAASDSTVLITGETGTGKDLAAENIHYNSNRRDKPYICVNCAALPESLVESELFGHKKGAFTGAVCSKPGKFALADGGSIFLDEIGDMRPYAQAKILRTIESKEIFPLGAKNATSLDLRVIAATNRDPEILMTEGKFREDLYYRLNVTFLHMPPLRDRKEDIPYLTAHAIKELNPRFNRKVKGFTDEAVSILLGYDWPGNVRELMNLVESAFVNLPPREIEYIPLPKQFQIHYRHLEGRSRQERDDLLSALMETNWNKSKAAQKLNWSRTTIYRKMARFRIDQKLTQQGEEF